MFLKVVDVFYKFIDLPLQHCMFNTGRRTKQDYIVKSHDHRSADTGKYSACPRKRK